MTENITQINRLLLLETNAGPDVLLIDTIKGVEEISRPFRYVMTMLSEVEAGNPPKVDPHSLVGTSMTVSLSITAVETGDEIGKRYFTGLCERFVQSGANEQFAMYSATIVPWFSFLNYASNCRIFQDQDVPTIIQNVVSQHGYSAQLDMSGLTKPYTPRDYCVQYRETDFAFVSRLMEAEGIYYYFDHTDGDHIMRLADSQGDYQDVPLQPSFKYAPDQGEALAADSIKVWHLEEQMHTGIWTTRDYHHEAPFNRLEVSLPSTTVAAAGQPLETFDYPGDGAKIFNRVGSFGGVPPEEDKIVRTRIEAEDTPEKMAHGVSNCRAMQTGYTVSVDALTDAGSYLLTYIAHQISQQPAYRDRDLGRLPYENRFSAIPAEVLFVPPRVTPRSLAHGLQTGFVIDESPSGNQEEIWPDIYGRVRVRFNWDREAKYSCWIRVVQAWAGLMWGQQYIPRVGDEVAVTFLESDPDCPVVIGGIYNKVNMPMFTLPDNKTQSGIHTHSSPGGGPSNFNMLRFEDLIGNEEIYIQAEKDWNSLIKNNETRQIMNDRTTTIQVDESRTVVTGNDTIDVQQGNRTITVDVGNLTEEAKIGNISVKADGGNISTEALVGNISIKADVGTISVDGMASVTITGTGGVTITCGASSISMTPASISISAPMVMINS